MAPRAPSPDVLRALLDETTELVCTTGPDGRIDWANRAWRQALGYTLDEAAAIEPAAFVAPEQRDLYRDVARRLVAGEAVEDFEAVLLAKDGRRVVCRGRAVPVMVDGRCVATRALYRDLTAERQSGVLRARLAATLEATSDMVCIFTRDASVVYLNRAGRRLLGLSDTADLSALRVDDFHPPDSLEQLLGTVLPAALERGRWEGESVLLGAGGARVPVSLVIVAHPSLRRDDPPFFLSAILRDLRERTQAEERLRESERHFRGVLENLRTLAVTLDEAGRVTFANDHLLALTGWTRDEVVGDDWFARFVPDGAALRDWYREQLALDDMPAHFENAILRRDGTSLLVAWDNVVLHDADGRPCGTASVGRDVTDERRVKALRDQLIATTSHEVRNPLGAVRGALQILGRLPAVQDGRARELADVALRNTDRVIRLTNDLLDIERLDSGTALLNRVAVGADDVVASALETVRHAAELREVHLVHTLPAEPLPAWADVDRITQVLTNLLGNAIKFSPAGATVTVSAAAEPGGGVRFAVRDEGRGIPADMLEAVFERFTQVRAEDARTQRGAGLGLAICRAIVKQHGGRIWAESVLGAGSTFAFTLPGA